MAGKMCTGSLQNNAARPRNTKAYCEGLQARMLDAAPVDPHVAGSEASLAWQAGEKVAKDLAGGKVTAADAPCCAVDTVTIVPV